MNTSKILKGTIVGGIAMFVLGFLIYGMLLSGYMEANCDHSNARPNQEMIWWAIIVSNLATAFLLSYLQDGANTSDMMAGLKQGAIVGLFVTLGFDLMMYSMTTMYNSMTVIFVDSLAYAAMTGLSGAAIAWVNGMDKK